MLLPGLSASTFKKPGHDSANAGPNFYFLPVGDLVPLYSLIRIHLSLVSSIKVLNIAHVDNYLLCLQILSERNMLEDTRDAFPFEQLVFDVQHHIITHFVSARDLYSLALVSKNFKSLAIPALYRHVRLLPGLPFKLVSTQLSGAFTKSLALAQEAFTKQMLSPTSIDKAGMIRSLDWHSFSHGISPRQAFLELFPNLSNLRRFHITNAHPTDMAELDLSIVPVFPHLQEIIISGITHLPFILPILHSPHCIRAITLDGPSPQSVHLQLLQWIASEDLRNLEKLTLLASCALDEFKIEEIIEAWLSSFCAVRNSVKEVVLGFHSPRGGACNTEDRRRQAFSLKLFDGLFSVTGQLEWTRLEKLSLVGISFPEEGGRDSAMFKWRFRRGIHMEILDSFLDANSLLLE